MSLAHSKQTRRRRRRAAFSSFHVARTVGVDKQRMHSVGKNLVQGRLQTVAKRLDLLAGQLARLHLFGKHGQAFARGLRIVGVLGDELEESDDGLGVEGLIGASQRRTGNENQAGEEWIHSV